jgi:hypothetical protein
LESRIAATSFEWLKHHGVSLLWLVPRVCVNEFISDNGVFVTGFAGIVVESVRGKEPSTSVEPPQIQKDQPWVGKGKHDERLLVSFSFNAPAKDIWESVVFYNMLFVKSPPSMTMTVIAALLLRIKLDHRVDSHDSHTGLDGTLQLLDLAHGRLQNTHLQAVDHTALGQIQTVVLVVLLLGERLLVLSGGLYGGCGMSIATAAFWGRETLWQSVAATELGNELGAVFCGVDGQGGGDDEEGLGEGANGELLARALVFG